MVGSSGCCQAPPRSRTKSTHTKLVRNEEALLARRA